VRVPGHLEAQHAEPTAAGLAMLLLPLEWRPMGSVTIGVLRPSGGVKLIDIDRIRVGFAERSRRPTVIADPSSTHAYVVGGLDEPVADVDLRSLSVRYRTLAGGPRPLGDTLGSNRFGDWLAPGRMVVGGWDDSKAATRRLGMSVVDTRTWRLTRIDPRADFFAKNGDLLLGLHLDRSLSAFGQGGGRRFSVAEQVFELATVATNGRYIYAYNLPPNAKGPTLVVDSSSGRPSWRQAPLPGAVLSPGLWMPGS
jgi:hypothetical protein